MQNPPLLKNDDRANWRRCWAGTLALLVLAQGLSDPVPASRATCQVQVRFELRDFRHHRRYPPAELSTLQKHIRRSLITGLSKRFTHVRFTDASQPTVLECVFNTGSGVDAPAQTAPRADAASFHFRLRGPTLEVERVHSWLYQEASDYFNAMPHVEVVLQRMDAFLGERADVLATAFPGGGSNRPDAESRFRGLFEEVLSRLPVFTDREVVHVANTHWLVVKTPRDEYKCSLPDLSEFKLRVDLPDPLGPQTYFFRTQLVNPTAFVREQPDLVPVELRRGLVTRAIEPLEETPPERLGQLTNVLATVDKSVYLLRPGPIDRPCLSTSPLDFQPDQR